MVQVINLIVSAASCSCVLCVFVGYKKSYENLCRIGLMRHFRDFTLSSEETIYAMLHFICSLSTTQCFCEGMMQS